MDLDRSLNLITLIFNPQEEILDDSWDQTSALLIKHIALHGVGLSRGCLSIGHYGAVPSLEDVLDQRFAYFLIDLNLVVGYAENVVVGIRDVFGLGVDIGVLTLESLVFLNSDGAQLGVLFLVFIRRPKAANYLDVFIG